MDDDLDDDVEDDDGGWSGDSTMKCCRLVRCSEIGAVGLMVIE